MISTTSSARLLACHCWLQSILSAKYDDGASRKRHEQRHERDVTPHEALVLHARRRTTGIGPLLRQRDPCLLPGTRRAASSLRPSWGRGRRRALLRAGSQ